MKIIQTFITSPMSVDRLKKNIIIAALSLAYAHKSGYKVKMYTDSLGYSILKRLPYDEINTELDCIKLSKNTLWSVVKYYALLKEPLKVIHTDFDVILKKPCLDGLLDKADATCQIKEHIESIQPVYEQDRTFLISNNCKDLLDLSDPVKYTYNVGIIGYNSESLRRAHAETIMTLYERFKDYDKTMPILDFYIEQAHLYNLSKKGYKIKPLIDNVTYFDLDYRIITECADNIGYCHLQSEVKYNSSVMKKVIGLLKKEFSNIYYLIDDIINITNI